MVEAQQTQAAQWVQALFEACRHLDAVSIEQQVLDAALVGTGASVAELWSSFPGEPIIRSCTHPSREMGKWSLLGWVTQWSRAVEAAATRVDAWLTDTSLSPPADQAIVLPQNLSRGEGYVWGAKGEFETASPLVVSCGDSPNSRRRALWLLYRNADCASAAANWVRDFVDALSRYEPASFRGVPAHVARSDDSLRNALTALRVGVQAELPEEVSNANPHFSVLFLKCVEDVGTPAMSFRFDSEQTEQLAEHANQPDITRIIAADQDLREAIIARGRFGLAAILEDVRYSQQFAGRVMRTCQAAKFEGWQTLSSGEFPRDQEPNDPRMSGALEVLQLGLLAARNLYLVPLIFAHEQHPASDRLADLIVLITSDKELESRQWLEIQFTVRRHKRFLQLANQLDKVREETRYASSRDTAHGLLSLTQKASAHLHGLRDSRNWEQRGPKLVQIHREIDEYMRRWLGRERIAPRTLDDAVRLAWQRQTSIRMGYAQLVNNLGSHGQLQLEANLGWAIVSTLEGVFDNALTASSHVRLEDAVQAKQELERLSNVPHLCCVASDPDFFSAHSPVVIVLADIGAVGLMIVNLCANARKSESDGNTEPTFLDDHGLALSNELLRELDWQVRGWSILPGLWCTWLTQTRN